MLWKCVDEFPEIPLLVVEDLYGPDRSAAVKDGANPHFQISGIKVWLLYSTDLSSCTLCLPLRHSAHLGGVEQEL